MKPYVGSIENAELYIGKNAGKRIRNLIESATSSIKIISPYISEETVELLKKKNEDNVEIKVISSDDKRLFGNNGKSSVLKKMICQKQIVNNKNEKIRDYLLKLIQLAGTIISIVIFVLWMYEDKWRIISNTHFIVWGVVLTLCILILIKIYYSIVVYTYDYSTHFPILFIVDPFNLSKDVRGNVPNNEFFHVKLFIIDEKIAFLGSVNLTSKGMRYNVESCITVESHKDVFSLMEYFDNLWQQTYLTKIISIYGRLLFKEPIN